VQAVANRLKQRNPGFDGKLEHWIVNGDMDLRFQTDAVVDISPVRVLPGPLLLSLITGSGKGKLSDLTPLRGMHLKDLKLRGCGQVRDLTPLQGMPLTILDLAGCGQVHDLTPLQGMPLTSLQLSGCGQLRDLTPLRGMHLKELRLWGCGQVRDLTPLRGMPLTQLQLVECGQVRDLTPLQGMPLQFLDIRACQVRDLTPLKGMPLKDLYCDFRPERDAEILRSIKTLEKINGKPATEILKPADGLKRPNDKDNAKAGVPDVTKRFPFEIAYPDQRPDWRIEGNELVQSAVANRGIDFGDPSWTDYDFSADVKMVDGQLNCQLIFRLDASWRRYGFTLDGGNGVSAIGPSVINAGPGVPRHTKSITAVKEKWYHLEIRVRAQQCDAFIDGKKIFAFTADDLPAKGRVGLRGWTTSCRFRNILVKDPKGKILLEGLPDL
jgi:hypothetical protein